MKHRDTINSTYRYMHMGNENICPHKTHTSMFISALFITAKKWKLSKCPSADEQINKMKCILTVDYYPSV